MKNSSKNNEKLELFETLSKNNFSLIRLDGKVPIEEGWSRYCIEYRSFEQIGFKPDDNAGIACGKCSNLVVLDVDDEELFNNSCLENGWTLPSTCEITTGSGKPHYYFTYPNDGKTYGNKANNKKYGFDIRGHGGQVVAPGSVHPDTGKTYTIVKGGEPAEMPEWLKKFYDSSSADNGKNHELSHDLSTVDIHTLKIPYWAKLLIELGIPQGKRSEAIISVLNTLINNNISIGVIFNIFENYPIGEKYREKGDSKESWLENQIEDAKEYVPKNNQLSEKCFVDKVDEYKKALEQSVVNINELRTMPLPKPEYYLKPWLKAATIAFIYAERGIGKSWFCLLLCLALTRKLNLGSWETIKPVESLYVDGEMNSGELQDRINKLTKGIPEEEQAKFNVLSSDIMHNKGFPTPELTNEAWRDSIFAYLKEHPEIKVMFIDNVSSMTVGIDENLKKDWDEINQWLISLRFQGVSVILVHHTGKNGKQRGTSAHEDNVDVSISLKRPKNYNAKDGAVFIAEFEKARSVCSSETNSLIFAFENSGDKLVWNIGNCKRINKIKQKDLIIPLLTKGFSQNEISKKIGCSDGHVSKVKAKAIEEGFLNTDLTFTTKGKEKFGDIEIDKYL